MRTRLQVYEEQTAPLIAYYGQGSLLRTIYGIGSIEEIQDAMLDVLKGSTR